MVVGDGSDASVGDADWSGCKESLVVVSPSLVEEVKTTFVCLSLLFISVGVLEG